MDGYGMSFIGGLKPPKRVSYLPPRIDRTTQCFEGTSSSPKRLSRFTQGSAQQLQRNLREFLYNSLDLNTLLNDTGNVLKEATESIGVITYIVSSDRTKIFRSSFAQHYANDSFGWSVSDNANIIAPYVAATKEFFVTANVFQDPRIRQTDTWVGIEHSDYKGRVKAAICAPVTTPLGECCGVVLLFRKAEEEPYSTPHVQTVVAMTEWMGTALHQREEKNFHQGLRDAGDYLLNLSNTFLSEEISIEKVVNDIMLFAKNTISAQRVYLYVIDRESKDLTADLYVEGVDGTCNGISVFKKKEKVGMEKDQGIAGQTVRSGTTINIKNSSYDQRFNKIVDSRHGHNIKTILSSPILSRNVVLGVIMLINKRQGKEFTTNDENLLESIAPYCALALEYEHTLNASNMYQIEKNVTTEMTMHSMEPCVHDRNEYSDIVLQELPEDFLSFSWYIKPEDDMVQLTFNLFSEVLEPYKFNLRRFEIFILVVRDSYRPNPYHNWEHAFNVCHCMYNILKRNMELFSDVEIVGLMISALCHDVDHRGLSNNFLLMVNHPIAQLYPMSPMENHHFKTTMMLLQATDMVEQLEKCFSMDIYQEIKDAILATDLSCYFQCRSKLLDILEDNAFVFEDQYHKFLLKSIMMTSCDLSGLCKPPSVSRVISKGLFKEWYAEGDIEKNLDFCPSSMMDRNQMHKIPQFELQFLSVVTLPCYRLLVAMLPNTQPLFHLCSQIRESWNEAAAHGKLEDFAPDV